ncbi:MAG: hypothetical protein GXO85_06660 [Chlorobi bacterium]|nr:hypothetical protein [Chlorobiota bacterium]
MKYVSKISVLVLLMFVNSLFINAQENSAQADEPSISVFKVSGQIGLYGELYSISGKDNRRPPATGRLFFRPTLTILDNFSINFDFLLSTEGSYARQQINRISIHPEWSWGKAHIGDFSRQFSRFTLNGETITGGGIELFPGAFRFEVVGGRTRRKTDNGVNSTYARYLGGMKIGLMNRQGFNFNISVIKAKDDIASIPRGNPDDSTNIRYSTTPKEDLVIGLDTKFNISKYFTFNGEVAASALTRDLNSTLIESEYIPKFATDIYKIRTSTNADYAYQTGVKFNSNIFNAGVDYLVINPGYQSLGLTTNINDLKSLSTNANLRLLGRKLTLGGNYKIQNNNLLSQKEFTLTRRNFGVSARYQPIRTISLGFNATRYIMENDAEEEERIENIVSSYAVNGMWQLKLFRMTHSLSASYSHQKSEDMNILRSNYSTISDNINFGISTMVSDSWTVAPRLTLNTFNLTNRFNQKTQTYSLMVMNRMRKVKLNNSLTFTYMNSSYIRSMIVVLQSGYSITKADIVKLNLRSSFYFAKVEQTSDFSEYRATLNYYHRF